MCVDLDENAEPTSDIMMEKYHHAGFLAIAAWQINGFVKANDFTGKTAIPFCTSSSSDMGESGRLLADMAGTGEWQDARNRYFTGRIACSKVQGNVNSYGCWASRLRPSFSPLVK